MNPVSKFRIGGIVRPAHAPYLLCLGLALQCVVSPDAAADATAKLDTVQVHLSEWAVSLTPPAVPPGRVVFEVTNSGKVPHALEIEGGGVEKSTSRIMPGASATLTLDLAAGTYEAYCPVGRGSHKMLGMTSNLSVGDTPRATSEKRVVEGKSEKHEDEEMVAAMDHGQMHSAGQGQVAGGGGGSKMMTIVGGGPVIQILPGPFPFADSAMAVIRNRPADQQMDLTKKSHLGPY